MFLAFTLSHPSLVRTIRLAVFEGSTCVLTPFNSPGHLVLRPEFKPLRFTCPRTFKLSNVRIFFFPLLAIS